MWSVIVRLATLCALYVLLAYCNVMVISQRLRIYDSLYAAPRESGRPTETRKLSKTVTRPAATQRPSMVHSTRASEDTKYIHGMTYMEHKEYDNAERERQQNTFSKRIDSNKQSAASEIRGEFSHRFRPVGVSHSPSWKMATVDPWPYIASKADKSTTISPYSYFNTTPKLRSVSWRSTYPIVEPYQPTARSISEIKSSFGRNVVQVGLRTRYPCCQNETKEVTSDGAQVKGRLRYYHSFSKEHGYAPHRPIKLITTVTAQRPTQAWISTLDVEKGTRHHNTVHQFNLGQSRKAVSGSGEATEKIKTIPRQFYRTTTWVPQTTKDRIHEAQLKRNSTNIQRNSTRTYDELPPIYSFEMPRFSFSGARRTSIITTTTKRPLTRDEYDYYDELEDRQTTAKASYKDSTVTNSFPNMSWTAYSAIPDRSSKLKPAANTDITRNLTSHPITLSAIEALTSKSSTEKNYDDNDDFEKWKVSIEQTVQRLRRPSNRGRSLAYRKLPKSSLTLEHDIAPLIEVSGVEEQDWKYVHETNQNELSTHRLPSSNWRRGEAELNMGNIDPTIDEFVFSKSRRTTTSALTSTTSKPTVYATTNRTWRPLLLTTRRHVPRRPIPLRVRHFGSLGHAVIAPRYRDRVYIPPAGILTDRHDTPGSILKMTTAKQSTFNRSSTHFEVENTTYPTKTTNSSSAEKKLDTVATTSTIHTTLEQSSRVPYGTSDGTHNLYATPHIYRLTTTTRMPVFGDGMSIEQQLVKAMKRLQERNRQIEQQQRERNSRRQQGNYRIKADVKKTNLLKHDLQTVYEVEGSGLWDHMLADKPALLEAVPEVAVMQLGDDSQIREEIQQTLTEQIDDSAIYGEFSNEHIIEVGDRNEPEERTGQKRTRFLLKGL
ncbi:uncharacterized protein LOC111261417 [Varroa jacobsoni]|uniref:uncharacterized protein LOC111261417 n=1 Tax=Varroa jacobsoni TaxID=62625 RepID=UPI000BF64A92|nr:uncharacterized protein LOC111261417 [Varroa jacobsoni]